jgi:ribosome biogenesis GTPase
MQGGVTQTDPHLIDLSALGWSAFYDDQRLPEDADLLPMRIATVHRGRVSAVSQSGPMRLTLVPNANTGDFAVGDWVLVAPETLLLTRRLDRKALLQRRTEGGRLPQLIAANVDTLFIVTSCNDDLNPARLERYLALANEAGTNPVLVLTKADQVPDVAPFVAQVAGLQRGLAVVALNAQAAEAARLLAPWCGPGQTVALVGSSGVGKSSLLNTLAGTTAEDGQATGAIREADAKGRHTTTSRSLHQIAAGGWAIDTPGMRTLHVSETYVGLDHLFAEIIELAPQCRFRNCTHAHEPGCAVQAAVAAGTVDAGRVARWRKLVDENATNTPVATGPKGNKSVKPAHKRR